MLADCYQIELINLRVIFAGRVLAYAKLCLFANRYVFCNNCFVDVYKRQIQTEAALPASGSIPMEDGIISMPIPAWLPDGRGLPVLTASAAAISLSLIHIF